MKSVMPRNRDLKRTAGRQPSPSVQATAVAALMRSSSANSHTARRAKPSRNVTTVYGKYIGRVGALAVALGVGGALSTTPGVAWADDSSSSVGSKSTSSESNSSSSSPESNSSSSSPSSGSSSSSVGQASTTSSEASTDESESSADESETSTSSETITTHESGAIVRSSGGQHNSRKTRTNGAVSSTDDDTPASTRAGQVAPPAASASAKTSAASPLPRSSSATSIRLAPADTTSVRLITAAATDGQAADRANQRPTTRFTPQASTSNAPQLIETAIGPADTPMSKPANLVAAALASLLDPGPEDPPESPVLLAVLAWARRQSTQELADQTTMQTDQLQPQTTAEASPADGVSPAAGLNALAEVSAQPNADAEVFAVIVAAEPAAAPLPAPWAGADVGAPALAGSSTYANGVFTVNGAGADIWGGADQFQFVHQTLTGDGQIIARVTAEENTDPWAKAGVMIKQSATAGAPYALLAVTPANGIALQSGFNQNTQAPRSRRPTPGSS